MSKEFPKKVICIQTGARQNYAVPSILQGAGLLEALYTDLNADIGLGAILRKTMPSFLKKGAVARLLNRNLPDGLINKTYSFDYPAFKYAIRQYLSSTNVEASHQALSKFDYDFSQALIRQGTKNATHVFSMFGEGANFLKFAKKQGLSIVVDAYLSPLTHRIVQDEREKFSDIESPIARSIIDKDYNHFKKVCDSTDFFLVPSCFVRDGLLEFGVPENKCHMVPYAAVSNNWFSIKNNPVKSRILFAGTANLRKGIHILGMAAEKLAKYSYDFRVAGGASETVLRHPLTKNLNFLGRVPRSHIQSEFATADIFVLPSLAEGSAYVTYEALASGLPVVTTKASGSVVRHGIDGLIVPEGDADALADAIKEILENRTLRDRMADAAKQHAQDYTWDKYAERLLNVFQSI